MNSSRQQSIVMAGSVLCLITALAILELSAAADDAKPAAKPAEKWTSLFNGKDLEGWELTKFGGEGEVSVRDGQLILGMGADLTGVHTNQKIPRMNYEVELDAMRVEGIDFFCGLTFPVNDAYCSLIIGGWSGGVCGLSSLDGEDASENETTSYQELVRDKWYHIRLRVEPKRIQAWLDKEQIVDVDTTDKKISTRAEVDLSQPFGFSSWQTTAALKNIRIRDIAQ